MNMMILLASGSPRRREILAGLGLDFEVLTEPVDESCDIDDPMLRVKSIAARKASAVRDMLVFQNIDIGGLFILGADTVVWCDGEFMGKPADRDDARRMLKKLSGGKHRVYTGIALTHKGQIETDAAVTEVEFCPMTDEEIERYLDSGEPFDKAGAYAVQGEAAAFIRGISGDYFNVVGLPVETLYRLLRERFGIDLFSMKKKV